LVLSVTAIILMRWLESRGVIKQRIEHDRV
jgi:hypothetical protein